MSNDGWGKGWIIPAGDPVASALSDQEADEVLGKLAASYDTTPEEDRK